MRWGTPGVHFLARPLIAILIAVCAAASVSEAQPAGRVYRIGLFGLPVPPSLLAQADRLIE